MDPERSPSNLREDVAEGIGDHINESGEPPTKRRLVFLQTMGQQLREVGGLRDTSAEKASPFTASSGEPSHTQPLTEAGTERPHGRQVQIQTPESDAVPGEDDQLPTGASMSASKSLWHPGEVLVLQASGGSNGFDFEDMIAWTRSYFDHWHPAFPFLHAPTILEYFDNLVQNAQVDIPDVSLHQVTIVRSIFSISLADRRQLGKVMRPVPPHLVFTSINDAIQSVQCLLTDESSILSLQAIVSVQLLLISMLRYNAASRLEGLAVRMAFHLGLHRCPMQFSAFPKGGAELRQRLFWSMYCIDRYICIRLGIPLAIRDTEINVCFPTSERHGGEAHGRSDLGGRLDLLGFLARHAEIRGSITELRNRSVSFRHTETDDEIVIGARLTKWWNEIDEYFESNNPDLLPISRYHQVVLVVLRHESTIALNKHTLATSKKSSAYEAALHTCIGAARSIITTLHKALEETAGLEQRDTHEISESPPLLWPSFTWAVWMSSFLIIYAANEDQIPQDVAIRLADRSLDILKHLTIRGSIWPNACSAAIRDLRAKLIGRRNRSKHTYVRHTSKDIVQNGDLSHAPSRSSPQQPFDRNIFNATPSNTVSTQHPQLSEESNRLPHSHPDMGITRDIVSSTQEISPLYHAQNATSENLSGPAQPMNRQNWLISELFPNFGDMEGSGYAYRAGAQLGPDLVPNFEGSELLYGMDTPIWLNNDQWMGMGGNG